MSTLSEWQALTTFVNHTNPPDSAPSLNEAGACSAGSVASWDARTMAIRVLLPKRGGGSGLLTGTAALAPVHRMPTNPHKPPGPAVPPRGPPGQSRYRAALAQTDMRDNWCIGFRNTAHEVGTGKLLLGAFGGSQTARLTHPTSTLGSYGVWKEAPGKRVKGRRRRAFEGRQAPSCD